MEDFFEKSKLLFSMMMYTYHCW